MCSVMENSQEVDSRFSHSSSNNSTNSGWRILSGRKLPKLEVVFLSQIALLYIVCICSLVNLSLGSKDKLWIILLTSSLGYLMPNPSLKKHAHTVNTNNSSDHVNAATVLPNAA